MHGEGEVDSRFNIVGMCLDFHWTYEQYLNRPLWFDEIYRIKCTAEAEASKHKQESANK